jgi:hypothetical protein
LANGKIGCPEMEEQEGKNQKLHGGISDDVDGADRYGGGNDKNDHTDENDLRGGVVQGSRFKVQSCKRTQTKRILSFSFRRFQIPDKTIYKIARRHASGR